MRLTFFVFLIGSFACQQIHASPDSGRGCYHPGSSGRLSCNAGNTDSQTRGQPRGFNNSARDNRSMDRSEAQEQALEDSIKDTIGLLENASKQSGNSRFHEVAVLIFRSKKKFDFGACRGGKQAFATPDQQSITFCNSGRQPLELLIHEGAHLTRENRKLFRSSDLVTRAGATFSPPVECDAEALHREAMTLNGMRARPMYDPLNCPNTLADFPMWLENFRSGGGDSRRR